MIFSMVPSPIGELLLAGDGDVLSLLHMPPHRHAPAIGPDWRREDEAHAVARGQLREYFDGTRTEFDLAPAPQGTPWQHRVWAALREVPYGETRSYGEIAAAIGAPGAARAVGHANGRNPISIVVPCHRVVGGGRSLEG
jgi:methylated-DNA-[protein]-cysteine S-methyltransferase